VYRSPSAGMGLTCSSKSRTPQEYRAGLAESSLLPCNAIYQFVKTQVQQQALYPSQVFASNGAATNSHDDTLDCLNSAHITVEFRDLPVYLGVVDDKSRLGSGGDRE